MSDQAQTQDERKIIRSFTGDDGIQVVRMESIDEKEHTAEFVISTESPVRDRPWGNPTALSMKGVVLKDYRANPVVLAQHQHGPIEVVGRSLSIGKEIVDDRNILVSRVQFDVDDEFAARVWGKVQRGFLRAASIGFRVLRRRTVEEGQVDQSMGLKGPVDIATQWRLLEWSIVAVGADAESLGRSGEMPEEPGAGADESRAAVDPWKDAFTPSSFIF